MQQQFFAIFSQISRAKIMNEWIKSPDQIKDQKGFSTSSSFRDVETAHRNLQLAFYNIEKKRKGKYLRFEP